MPEWRTIDTAPRDGSKVLLCKATDADGKPIRDSAWGVFVQVAAWWDDGSADEGGAWVVYCDLSEEPTLHFDPTHWMPLPVNPLLDAPTPPKE